MTEDELLKLQEQAERAQVELNSLGEWERDVLLSRASFDVDDEAVSEIESELSDSSAMR